jgi:hypothetical protein
MRGSAHASLETDENPECPGKQQRLRRKSISLGPSAGYELDLAAAVRALRPESGAIARGAGGCDGLAGWPFA